MYTLLYVDCVCEKESEHESEKEGEWNGRKVKPTKCKSLAKQNSPALQVKSAINKFQMNTLIGNAEPSNVRLLALNHPSNTTLLLIAIAKIFRIE